MVSFPKTIIVLLFSIFLHTTETSNTPLKLVGSKFLIKCVDNVLDEVEYISLPNDNERFLRCCDSGCKNFKNSLEIDREASVVFEVPLFGFKRKEKNRYYWVDCYCK